MKKYLYSMLAMATMLFAASCTQEDDFNANVEGTDVEATFTIDLPAEMGTRAIGDGMTVNAVACAVYDESNEELRDLYIPDLAMANKKATYKVRLAKGQAYRVAFFAYNKEAGAYDIADLKNIIVLDSQLSNREDRDAFTAYVDITPEESMNPINKTIYLKRPFAQLNLGSLFEDIEAARKSGIVVTDTKITVTNVYTAFSAFDNEVVGGTSTRMFDYNDQPTDTLSANGGKYDYLALNYLLVGDLNSTKSLHKVTFEWVAASGKVNDPVTEWDNVPMQRNYRTNILGYLLTNPAEFNIIVDEQFEEPDYNEPWVGDAKEPAYDAATKTYTVMTPEELAWVAQQTNGTFEVTRAAATTTFQGQTIKLGADIDLCNYPWTPIGTSANNFKGTFDGNGKTIKNLNVNVTSGAGLFGYILGPGVKNLTVDGAKIVANHYAGVICGYAYGNFTGNTVKNATIDVTPNLVAPGKYDNGDKAGAIVGYVGESGYTLTGNTVKNVEINAYRDLGGVAGAAHVKTFEGNSVNKVTLRADQVNEFWYADKAANAGIFVGRLMGGTIDEAKNSSSTVTIETNVNPVSVEEFEEAVKEDLEHIVINVNGVQEFKVNDAYIAIGGEKTKTITINGVSDDAKLVLSTTYWSRFSTVNPDAQVIFNDLTVTSTQASGTWNSYDVTLNCNVECNNVVFEKAVAFDKPNATVVLNNVTVKESHDYYAMWISAAGQNVTIDGGNIASAGRGIKIDEQYVSDDDKALVTLKVSKFDFNTNKKAAIMVKSAKGAAITVANIDINDVYADPVNAVWVDADAAEYADLVNVTGCTKVIEGEGFAYVRTADQLRDAIKDAKIENIVLANGTYEGLFYVTRGLNLKAHNQHKAVINGKIGIAASGKTINIDGLKLTNAYSGSVAAGHQYLDKTGTYTIGLYCATVNVENCLFDLKKDGGINFYAINEPEYVTVKNCTFNANGFRPILSKVNVTVDGCTFNDQYKYSLQVWGNKNSGTEKVVFTNNIINNPGKTTGKAYMASGVSVSKSYPISNVEFVISGNTPTNYVYDKHDNVKVETFTVTPGVVFVPEDALVADGVFNNEGVYEISNKAGMFWFANEVNVKGNSFAGKTVKLAADINLENDAWTPVGQTGATTFNGVFDGQNHTIKNLNVYSGDKTGADYSSGLFGWVESHTAGQGHLKNVTIEGAIVVGHHNCGALVGYITQETALVENCHVTGADVSCTHANGDADGDKAGALIGNATVATPVKNCTAANSIVSAGRDAGQVVGAAKAVNVINCTATDVTVTANGEGTGANIRNEVIGRIL